MSRVTCQGNPLVLGMCHISQRAVKQPGLLAHLGSESEESCIFRGTVPRCSSVGKMNVQSDDPAVAAHAPAIRE